MEENEVKKEKIFYKKWWFWAIIIGIAIISFIIIIEYIKNKETETSLKNIGEGATNFIEGIYDADSHLDEFTYNYTTGEVEYKPEITIEKYNQVKEGMTEEEVVSILGSGEKLQPEEANGFLMVWGDIMISNPPYYRIQIAFNSSGKVINKYQLGLE